MSAAPIRIDLLCQCLDNFGDAGISWRLARLLVDEWDADVRLCIDQPELVALWAARARQARRPNQKLPVVVAWESLSSHAKQLTRDKETAKKEADLLIAMLGTSIPPSFQGALASRKLPWIRYEYLTAESWVDEFHALPSIKPHDGTTEWFYYPGFSTASGGLLRERRLPSPDKPTSKHLANASNPEQEWLVASGLNSAPGRWRVCLFGYPDQSTRHFLAALDQLDLPVAVLISRSLAVNLDLSATPATSTEYIIHDWLDQPDFDRLMASCDLNVVRGEDSWLRAQWAGKPMLWQPYRQADAGHLDKLHAFLGRSLSGVQAPVAAAVTQLMLAMNGAADMRPALNNWLTHREAIATEQLNWRAQLLEQTSLTERLAAFCRVQLQLPV